MLQKVNLCSQVKICKLTFMHSNTVLPRNAMCANVRQDLLLLLPRLSLLAVKLHLISTPLPAQLSTLFALALLFFPLHPRLLHLHLPFLLRPKLRIPLLRQLSHTPVTDIAPLAHKVGDAIFDLVVERLQFFGRRRVAFGVRAIGLFDEGLDAGVR